MIYTTYYNSSLGKILLAADDDGIIGLWFENQKYYADVIKCESISCETDILKMQNNGWIFIFQVENLIIYHIFI